MNQGEEPRLPAHLREVARMLAERKFNPEIARGAEGYSTYGGEVRKRTEQLLGARDRAGVGRDVREPGELSPLAPQGLEGVSRKAFTGLRGRSK